MQPLPRASRPPDVDESQTGVGAEQKGRPSSGLAKYPTALRVGHVTAVSATQKNPICC